MLAAAGLRRTGTAFGSLFEKMSSRAMKRTELPGQLFNWVNAQLGSHLYSFAPVALRILGHPRPALSIASSSADEAPLHRGFGMTVAAATASTDRMSTRRTGGAIGTAFEFAHALLWMSGKKTGSGKNKRMLKPANRGARPCNHVGRRSRRPRGARYRG